MSTLMNLTDCREYCCATSSMRDSRALENRHVCEWKVMTTAIGRGLTADWLERQYVKYVFSLHSISIGIEGANERWHTLSGA